ncbi:MAG: hypothetical protein ACRDP4_14880, partial [Nocardioidaceae bacterium]
MRKSFYAAASLAAGAALMLGGCGQTGKSIEEGAKPPAAKTSSTCPKGQVHVGANGPCADKSVAEALAKAKEKAAKPKPSPTKTHTPKPDPTEQVAKWGQTFTYKDGL